MGFVVRYRFLWYDSFSLGSEPRLYPTPPTLPPQTQIWPGSDVSSPPWCTLTPKNLTEMSLASDGLCSALSLPLVRQFFIGIWTTTVSYSPHSTSTDAIWPGSDVSPPPWYTLTPKILTEMSLANDGLCSALSLPLVRQFFIEIWTTTVSDSPLTDANMVG